MKKKENIVSFTAEEIDAMLARGESKTDWERLEKMTEGELEANIASDPDWKDIPRDWYKHAVAGIPLPLPVQTKQQVTLRLDPEILAYFKKGGRGWQSRINAVLKTFVHHSQ